jgi:hypothetical protein
MCHIEPQRGEEKVAQGEALGMESCEYDTTYLMMRRALKGRPESAAPFGSGRPFRAR